MSSPRCHAVFLHPLICLTVGLLATACNQPPAPFKVEDRSPRADREAPFDPPSGYPDWAYDSQHYMKPGEELKPEPRVRPGDPLYYFTNHRQVMIRQPAGYTAEDTPRIAVWWTDDNGFHWNKGGYFGRQQSYFPFEVADDGDFGIRFVGPGQATAAQVPAEPERVYHVDTTAPEVEVRIEPEQSWYHVGQTITISWQTTDAHLVEYPVRIGLLKDFSAEQGEMTELQRGLADEGSITYQIPPDALDHEIRFRVEAGDRAGNLATAVSYALQVVKEEEVRKPDASSEEEPSQEVRKEKATTKPDQAALNDASGPQDQTADEAGTLDGGEGGRASDDASQPATAAAPFANRAARLPNDDELLSWDGPFFAASPEATEGVAAAGVSHTDLDSAPAGGIEEMDDAESRLEGDNQATRSAFDQSDQDATAVARAEAPTAMEPPETESALEPTKTTPPVFPDAWQFVRGDEAAEEETGEQTPLDRASSAAIASAVDLTHGNGLLVPLPATVQDEQGHGQRTTAHPWRILGAVWEAPLQTVWSLPRPRFAMEIYQALEGRFLADHPALRPVTEPGAGDHAYAGLATPEREESSARPGSVSISPDQ